MANESKTLYVYLNREKTRVRRITPSPEFNGDWKGLADGVTYSNDQTKRYHHFEVK